jgi:NADPH:quinone reductase-like Zn-dependent oxidoreductase
LKAMMYAGFGGPDQLHLADIPTPTPEGDQILVRVRASSINSWDWDKLRGPRGLTRLLGPQDTILGCDVSGEVVSCGPEAGDFKAGDRVFGDLSFYGFGAYAEFACASQSAFCAIPEGLDYLQAASLPQGGFWPSRDWGEIHLLLRGSGCSWWEPAVRWARSPFNWPTTPERR